MERGPSFEMVLNDDERELLMCVFELAQRAVVEAAYDERKAEALEGLLKAYGPIKAKRLKSKLLNRVRPVKKPE